jgi:RHS repeat-associated protein
MWDPLDPAANQVGATPIIAHDYMMREYTAKEESIVYMYVSNESPTLVDVYFDDVTMTHTPSNVIQYNEYYPFQNPTQNSWTRVNAVKNNFLGNGGTELNTTSNLYDLEYRNYDPVLGRMNGVDPMASKYSSLSPYNYSFNAPNMVVDVNGADPNSYAEWLLNGIRSTLPAVDGGGGGGGYTYAYGRNSEFGAQRLQLGSGSWSLNVGGLEVNYNLLRNGVHLFGFGSGGALQSYDAYDFQMVNSIYGTTYKFIDQFGNSDNDLVYAFGYGSNNYIVHTNQYLASAYEGSNWNHFKASGMLGMILEMNSRSGKNQIENMVIVAHGNWEQIHIGKDILSLDDFKNNTDDVSTFNILLNFMKTGGNLVFHSCYPGVYLGSAMKGNIRSDVNVFLNGDVTTGGGKRKPGTIDEYMPGTEYVKFGTGLTKSGDYLNGWMNVNSDFKYKNIIINKNGTITTIK